MMYLYMPARVVRPSLLLRIAMAMRAMYEYGGFWSIPGKVYRSENWFEKYALESNYIL